MPASVQVCSDFDAILAMMAELPDARHRPLDELRAGYDRSALGPPEPVEHIGDHRIPVDGGEIGARLYRPSARPTALLIYYHGGGWVFGDLESHDRPLRSFANLTGMAILSVDYRLSPEHPFPVPLEDALAALRWAAAHVGELAVPDAPLLVGGDSAGGNLAAAAALASREDGPALAGQLLLYPVLDGRCDSGSYASRADCKILTSEDMRWYWTQYIADAAGRDDPRASPPRTVDLSGAPPAIVAVAGIDPLRDEAIDYAAALAKAGVRVNLLHYPTQPHGFFSFGEMVPSAKRAFDEIVVQTGDLVRSASR